PRHAPERAVVLDRSSAPRCASCPRSKNSNMLTPLSALWMALVLGPTPCTTVPPMFYSDIAKTAELIVLGTATRCQCRAEEGGNRIRAYVTFDRLSPRKGSPGASLTLRLDGGTVGEDRLVVAEMPRFKVGSSYLLYVAGNGTAVSPIVGFYQGAFEIVTRDGREVLLSQKGLEL